MSLALGPKLLVKVMHPLFTKYPYIFEMITNFANNIVLIFLPPEVLECFGPRPQFAPEDIQDNAPIIYPSLNPQ